MQRIVRNRPEPVNTRNPAIDCVGARVVPACPPCVKLPFPRQPRDLGWAGGCAANGWTPSGEAIIFLPVSKTSKSAGAGEAADVSFGDALAQLQRVVEEMESDELPLETMLARYEEGIKLARVCEAKLTAAEVRIQQLETNAAGEAALKPFVEASQPETE